MYAIAITLFAMLVCFTFWAATMIARVEADVREIHRIEQELTKECRALAEVLRRQAGETNA